MIIICGSARGLSASVSSVSRRLPPRLSSCVLALGRCSTIVSIIGLICGGSSSSGAVGGSSCGPVGIRMLKVEPTLRCDSTRICPFCISTSDLAIGRPSPVPPTVRVSDESTWRKASNSSGRSLSAMPMPVSTTSVRTSMRPLSASCTG